MNLQMFLSTNAKKIDRAKICPSDRFLDGENKVYWEIACITAYENNLIKSACVKEIKNSKGMISTYFDSNLYQSRLTARCVTYPNLNDINLQNSYGVCSAEDLVCTMLSPGEFEKLSTKVLEVNGFKSESELVETAKN